MNTSEAWVLITLIICVTVIVCVVVENTIGKNKD